MARAELDREPQDEGIILSADAVHALSLLDSTYRVLRTASELLHCSFCGFPSRMTGKTIFGRILCGEISCDEVYSDDHCLAFRDIQPQAPVHVLVIPRKPIESLRSAGKEDCYLLGHLLLVATKVASQEGLEEWRTVINSGASAGQTVFHLHVHVIGGRPLTWPPG